MGKKWSRKDPCAARSGLGCAHHKVFCSKSAHWCKNVETALFRKIKKYNIFSVFFVLKLCMCKRNHNKMAI